MSKTGKYLHISDVHLSMSTMDSLYGLCKERHFGITENGVMVYPAGLHGFFIPVSGEERLLAEPKDLKDLLMYVHENGCDLVLVDGYGERVDLPGYGVLD